MDKRQTLRYDHLWNWKDCVIKAGYSFLCNSVHLWTVPLSFTLFMADYTYQASGPSWSHLVHNKIKLLEHQRLLSEQAGYVQWDQLSVVIEDSRWQLLYLVVTQFPRKRYSLISVKIVAIAGFFNLFSVSCTVIGLCFTPLSCFTPLTWKLRPKFEHLRINKNLKKDFAVKICRSTMTF